jgi:ribonuclease-3
MQSQDPRSLEAETPQEFVSRLNLPVQDTRLIGRALTHSSYLNEHPEALEDNERLEFLGDAVLDFLVGAWLYSHYPEKREGELTLLRSALVRTEQLADFARQIDLGRALRMGRGELENGGRGRAGLLCGGFEALVGALYLGGGMLAVEEFLSPLLRQAADHILATSRHRDPKSILQEWAQARSLPPPFYRSVSEEGPDHERIFEVGVVIAGEIVAVGRGTKKQMAAKAAARLAMQKLGVE